GQLDAAPAPPWEQAAEALGDFKRAVDCKDAGRFRRTLAGLESVIRSGAGVVAQQEASWEEVRELVQEGGRVAAAEWRRVGDVRGLITVEQAMAFAKRFWTAAEELIHDRELLAAVQERTLQLLPAE